MPRRIPRTPRTLARHELVGLPVEVVGSPDPSQVGLSGRVVDETRGTLVVETDDDGTERQVAKAGRTFRFVLEDRGPGKARTVEVPGDALAHRPRDRTKKAPRRAPTETTPR